jgi:hypothetical protein
MIDKAPAGDRTTIIAHDYIALKLNICSGATINAALIAALAAAEGHFTGTTPLGKTALQDLHQTFMVNKDLVVCTGGSYAYCP